MSELDASAVTLTLGGRRVLDAVSARFARGRVCALLGANGAGKSSLLSCLSGLRAPDNGAVRLDGTPLGALPARDRARRIGLLPQGGAVHWNMDVASLVGLGRLPHRGRGGETAADRAAVARAMAATDVAAFAGRGMDTLSGGERSRVLLARVLAGEPEWLLADEPLASLDPAHQLEVLAQLRAAAAAGAGVIVVLHDLSLAARWADEAVLLANGRLVAAGAVETVLTPPFLARAYGVRVEIGRTADGQPWVMPLGRA